MSENDQILNLKRVSFGYAQTRPVLLDIDLHVSRPECVCLLGPSGSGKTTLLRLIQGFLRPVAGQVTYAPPEHSNNEMAFVSQEYALFPHLTARENVELVLRRRSGFWRRIVPDGRVRTQALECLDQVGVSSRADAFPSALSGGQKQRVCIAQALAQAAPLLLMDEPFGAIDEDVREQLQELVIKLRNEHDLAILFVTHDLEEALYLADRLYLLRPKDGVASIEEYPVVGASIRSPEIKQGEAFYKQLQALRSHFYRAQSLGKSTNGRPDLIQRGLIDEAILSTIERHAEEIWVITAELRQDMDNPLIRAAVKSNLEQGKRYRYVIPAGNSVAAENVKRLKDEFTEHAHQITIDTLPADTSIFFFGEVVLYDPLTENTSGYTYLGGEHRGLMVKLPTSFIEAHVRQLRPAD